MSTESDRIIDLYERTATLWDAERHRHRLDSERRWIKRFLSHVSPGAAVLDLGCGSGEPIAADIVAAGHPVTGVDSAPSFIATCRHRFPEQEWILADMRQLDLGRAFGGILAWHSMFHLTQEDQEQMFLRLARHAAPGAPLMFTSGPERGVRIGSWQGEPLYHASLDAREYEALLATNGFEIIDHVVEDAQCGGATIWLAKRISV
jgi:trans-aconitate methyltransferase